MSGTVTDPKVISATSVGLDWQASEGEALASGTPTPKQFLVVQSLSRDPDPTYLHPNGTHGSIFERFDGDRIISQAFKKELKLWGSRFQLLPFIESALSGNPTAANADITRGGPAAAKITNMTLSGVRPYHNTSAHDSSPSAEPKVYIQVNSNTYPHPVHVYTDAAHTDEVASGEATASGVSAVLNEVNDSNLTGTITLGSGITSGAASGAIGKITFAFANQYTKFFRLFYCDGVDTFALSDCVVSDLMFESAENAELSVTASIMGKRREKVSSAVMAIDETQLDLVSYSHSELTLTKDPGGSPITPVVDSFTFGVKNNVLQYIANSATPQKLIKRGFVKLGGNLKGESADETTGLVDLARANTAVGAGFTTMRADYTLNVGSGSKTFRLDMPVKVRPVLKEPGVSGELVEKVDLDYEVLYDGVTTPLAVTVEI